MHLDFRITASQGLQGEITVPGDKSISHRALMLAAIAEGTSHIQHLLEGEDNLATLRALSDLGVHIEKDNATYIVHGVGMHGLKPTNKPLDLGNSGTGMRLMAGLLAGQHFDSELIGDQSLMGRPMARIVEPLRQMGAQIAMSEQGTAPLTIKGGCSLKAIQFDSPVASAQVKGGVLLAGLYAQGTTQVCEPASSRDHTERLLEAMGVQIKHQDNTITLNPPKQLKPIDVTVPADFSSAAFFIVAATIVPHSEILIKNVGVNSTRVGMLSILKSMGADIEVQNQSIVSGEPVATIRVRYAPLHGITIPEHLIPLAIDEFPVLMVAAACAEGETVLRGAQELKVKESDRLVSTAKALQALGIKVDLFDDGMRVDGGHFQGGEVNSFNDHRIAMAFSIAGSCATQPVRIYACDSVGTSFPNFVSLAKTIGMNIEILK